MAIKTVKVSDKGQIAIPQSIRENMGIEKGDELIMLQIDGRIMLEKSQQVVEDIKDDFKDLLKLSESSLKKIWDNKENEIWNKYLKK